MLSKGARITQ